MQRAEIERARQANIGQLRATGFQQALGAAQAERQRQLQGGQLLGALGAQQQQMSWAYTKSVASRCSAKRIGSGCIRSIKTNTITKTV